MINGSLKHNGKPYKPGSWHMRQQKISTLIARQLLNDALRPFTNMGSGHGPSAPTAQAQGGQHKQAGAGAGGLGFDEINKSKKRK